jgi:hypothetical protein
VPVKLRQSVTVDLAALSIGALGVPAVFAQALALIGPAVTVEHAGGSFSNDITVPLPASTVGVAQLVSVSQQVDTTLPSVEVSSTATSEAALHEMGVDKSTTQSIGGDTWTTMTGWVVRSGFPRTVISGNGVAVNVASPVRLSTSLTLSGTPMYWSSTARILVNGTPVVTGSTVSDSGTYGATVLVDVAQGDVVTVQSRNSHAFGNAGSVAAGSSSYLTVTAQ